MNNAIPKTLAKEFAGNKTEFYNAMLLNNFYLGSKNSSCMTYEYMEKVRIGDFYVPKFTELKVRPCPYPPLKQVIFQEIVNILKALGKKLGIKSFTAINLDWMIMVLSTLKPEHRFFAKDYLPT